MKISVQTYRATDSIRNSLRKRLVSSRTLAVTIIVGSFILLACLYIWQRVYVLNLVREVSTLEKEKVDLKDLLKKTEIEVTELSRLNRIEPIAIAQLGLMRTGTENLYTLTPRKVEKKLEGIDEVVAALKKIADNLPILNETKASTDSIFEFDAK